MKLLDTIRKSWRIHLNERLDLRATAAARRAECATAEQKLIVDMLGEHAMSGRDLRSMLWTRRRDHVWMPSFYRLMADLEDAGVVHGWYASETIDGQSLRQRWYKLADD